MSMPLTWFGVSCGNHWSSSATVPEIIGAAIEVPPARIIWPSTMQLGHIAANRLFGASVETMPEPRMGSEDFSFVLHEVPGTGLPARHADRRPGAATIGCAPCRRVRTLERVDGEPIVGPQCLVERCDQGADVADATNASAERAGRDVAHLLMGCTRHQPRLEDDLRNRVHVGDPAQLDVRAGRQLGMAVAELGGGTSEMGELRALAARACAQEDVAGVRALAAPLGGESAGEPA